MTADNCGIIFLGQFNLNILTPLPWGRGREPSKFRCRGAFCMWTALNLIKKFLWERGFLQNRNDAKQKPVIWPQFWNGYSFVCLFAWIWFLLVYKCVEQHSSHKLAVKVFFFFLGGGELAQTGGKYLGRLRGHIWMILPIDLSVLLYWIQTTLSWKTWNCLQLE